MHGEGRLAQFNANADRTDMVNQVPRIRRAGITVEERKILVVRILKLPREPLSGKCVTSNAAKGCAAQYLQHVCSFHLISLKTSLE
jgi:hypothetical protein